MARLRRCGGSGRRRVGHSRAEHHVGAAAVVVLDPKSQGTPQMSFRERNEPVQTLATYRPDHPFAEAVRHRTARRRFQNAQPQAADRGVELPREDAVAVMKQITVADIKPEGLAQLLARLSRRRVRRHIAVNQPSTAMLDHHQYVQEPEGARHAHEEVARHDRLRMVLQERRPALVATWATHWRFRYFRTVRGETCSPSFTHSSLAIRS